MRRTLGYLLLIAFLPALVLGQEAKSKSGIEPVKVIQLDRKDPIVFEKDIEPIFADRCTFCHSGNVKEGKFDMGSFEAMMKGGKSGKAIVPGKADESLLVKLISRSNEKRFMPPKSEDPVTPEEFALIKMWIDQGAKPPTMTREKPKAILTALPANVRPVRALAISPDKNLVAAGRANEIHLFDAASGNHLRALLEPNLTTADKKPIQAAHLSIVEALAFSPDGKTLASGSYQEVTLWDVDSGNIKQKLSGFADRVVALAFSRDGKYLATGGGAPTEDGEIKVFDMSAGGKVVLDLKGAHSDTVFGLCFSPDNSKLASCGADKFVKVFELPEGKFLKSFEGHTHHVLDVGWKGDGKLLASGGGEQPTATGPGPGVIKVWDYEKGEQVRTINAHSKQITRLLFIGTTSQVVTASGDQTVKVFNVDNGGAVRTITGGGDFLYAIGVSPDGALVASGGEEGIIRLYNGTNGQLLKTLLPPGVDVPMPKK